MLKKNHTKKLEESFNMTMNAPHAAWERKIMIAESFREISILKFWKIVAQQKGSHGLMTICEEIFAFYDSFYF